MDLLFSRYASPLDFMKLYIDQGRFGEFVEGIIGLENKRRKETDEKENDDKLWQAYIHSMSDKSFIDWKRELTQENKVENHEMTDKDITNAIEQARKNLKKFKPH